MYPIIVLAPIAALAVNCATQIATARLRPGMSPYASMAAGIVAGVVTTVACTAMAERRSHFGLGDRVSFHALNVAIYLALAFGYFNFVNLTIASLRIRLLGELAAAGGSLQRMALLKSYNTEKVIALRIDRLVRGGHLRERNGRYFIGKKRFLMVAGIYNLLRRLVIGPWPQVNQPVTAAECESLNPDAATIPPASARRDRE